MVSKILSLLFSSAVLLFSSQTQATEPTSIDNFIKFTYPNKYVKAFPGKLGPTPEETFVLQIGWQDEEDGPMAERGQIAIIKRTPAGGFQIAAQSQAGYLFRCEVNDLVIKNGVINYSYSQANGCCSKTDYTFKFRASSAGEYQLIGLEVVTEDFGNSTEDNTGIIKSGSSVNFNTKTRITWTTEKGKRKETSTQDKGLSITTLNNFNLENF